MAELDLATIALLRGDEQLGVLRLIGYDRSPPNDIANETVFSFFSSSVTHASSEAATSVPLASNQVQTFQVLLIRPI